MKKLIISVVFAVYAAAAMAMASPKDIEGALAANRMQEARSMVTEVLREKPDSARAHLLNAYILIHADHDRKGAGRELDLANSLDKKGDVRNSPLFGRVATEIDLQRSTQVKQPSAMPLAAHQKPVETISKPAPSYPTYAAVDSSKASYFGLTLLFFVTCFLVLSIIMYVVFKSKKQPTFQYARANTYDPHVSELRKVTYDPPPAPAYVAPAPVLSYPPAQTYQVPQREPMGAMGTAASVAGGVVAGNMISDMLRHNHSSHSSHNSYYDEAPRVYEAPSPAPAPAPEPTYSYSSSRSSFSSGSDDSWSSRNDSWSSGGSDSSWDSGSSSSSSDSSWD